ncbi:MAG: GNAT family N-acetyltransferase [Dysgonomonas sp.]|jgi:GNAT superfamily N-acetyltransferase|uniref:GNAT family N-acetyltransferase n=1 Tax=unclassified Dysgonomonas TaxID=2630389 RepID=UPI0025C232A5|nr:MULTISPECIES: GNAT family N-acetyltransferase [unclassified Dysgonomonas]MDR1714267.1 GNAT family N-acetyltransferase [Prevotella sp.]MDR2003434.1 GNAT family N-acetyltransferase [Prevotella sp.]HMM01347.1 GNAT family N-acetyltransferase [Dysgonomonas sp.]
MNIDIQPIKESDFEELVSLFLEFATFEKLPEKMTNSAGQMLKEKDYFHGFVARDGDGSIIGYATYFFAYYTWTGKSLYMDDLYVRQTYRGKGIGTRLINAVIAYAKEECCNGLRWQVSEWNHPAITFYKSLGATINEVERNCDLLF